MIAEYIKSVLQMHHKNVIIMRQACYMLYIRYVSGLHILLYYFTDYEVNKVTRFIVKDIVSQ